MENLIREAQSAVKKFNLGVETIIAMGVISLVKGAKASGRFIKKHYRGIAIVILAAIIVFLLMNPREKVVTEKETEYVYIEVPVATEDATEDATEESAEAEEMTARIKC